MLKSNPYISILQKKNNTPFKIVNFFLRPNFKVKLLSTEAQCITQGGICQTTTTLCEYPSQFVNNICSDDSSVQCCLPGKKVELV